MRTRLRVPAAPTAACGALCALAVSAGAWHAQAGIDGGRAADQATHQARGAMGPMAMDMPHMAGPMAMDMPRGRTRAGISVPQLTGPTTAAHVRTFTLTARPARLAIGPRMPVDAWTFNGTAPGPVLRVRQGDLVVVHLVNKLPVGTTIHWHGVVLPNAEDGVAGVTQDAVAPGHTYTYRFLATRPGTYWYHAHQDGLTEVARGLFGALVIDPASPGPPASVDATVALHAWDTGQGSVLTVNATSGQLRIPAPPGAWVRLRLINTDNVLHQATVVGAPFTVIALDGHDLNGPQPLTATALPIGAAQRYDLLFRMPARGAVGVRLASVSDDRQYDDAAAIVVGSGALPPAPSGAPAMFDMTYLLKKSGSVY